MILFVSSNCPKCESLKPYPDDVTVMNIDSNPDALAEADFFDIVGVPALVTDGGIVRDFDDVREILEHREM